MPCRYVIDVGIGLIITTGWGRVTFDEMKAHQERLLNDPDFDPQFNQLVDGTAVTALEASARSIEDDHRAQVFLSELTCISGE
jgi:hypothetical protein